jgi:hypothetical protein
MQRTLDRVEWKDVPLDQAVEELRARSGANIVVDWKALEDAGIDRQETLIDLKVHDVTTASALRLVLDQASGGTVRLSFRGEDNVVHVSTVELLNRLHYLRIYEASDIIDDLAEVARRHSWQSPGSMQYNGGYYAPGELTDLVKGTSDADVWMEGGGVFSATVWGGKLAVNATPEIHVQDTELLRSLRSRAKAVSPTTTEVTP